MSRTTRAYVVRIPFGHLWSVAVTDCRFYLLRPDRGGQVGLNSDINFIQKRHFLRLEMALKKLYMMNNVQTSLEMKYFIFRGFG